MKYWLMDIRTWAVVRMISLTFLTQKQTLSGRVAIDLKNAVWIGSRRSGFL